MNHVDLTERQRGAVVSSHKNILCIAGPGSGKTEVLARRIRRVVEDGADPAQLVAITYTNKAARNLQERVGSAQHPAPAHAPNLTHNVPIVLGFAGTLHGFCLRMLRDHGTLYGYGARTGVIDEDAAAELLADKAEQQGSKATIKKLLELKALGRPVRLSGIPYSRDQLVVVAYCEELREAGLLDFDLILTEFLRLLRLDPVFAAAISGRFTHIFWDEKQDSGGPDWDIAEYIPISNKFLVGDPDQSIFGFRGSTPGRLLEYAKRRDVEIHTLEENFRCAQEICEAANRLIWLNPNRLEKETVPVAGAIFGEVNNLTPSRNEAQEINFVMDLVRLDGNEHGGSVAILCRSNAVADSFRAAAVAEGYAVEEEPKDTMPPDWGLARALIEFLAQPNSDTLAFFYVAAREVKRGMKPLEARRKAHEIRRAAQAAGKSISAQWFDFVKDHRDSGSTANYVGRMLDREGISRESTAIIVTKMTELPFGSGLDALALSVARNERAPVPKNDDATITITTIHSAKGREWDAVFIAGYEDELTPGHAKSADVEEERRLAFVAITRARFRLYFSSSATRRASWGNRPIEDRHPSRFISEALT